MYSELFIRRYRKNVENVKVLYTVTSSVPTVTVGMYRDASRLKSRQTCLAGRQARTDPVLNYGTGKVLKLLLLHRLINGYS